MKQKAEKAFKHKVELFGKTVPTMILIGLLLAGTGSAALLTSFGTVSGTADVSQAVLVNGEPKDDVAEIDGFDSFAAGTYRLADLNSESGSALQVESNASVATSVTVDTQYEGSQTEEGIVAENIVYNQPSESNFDVVVSDESGLEEAIKNSESSRILVEPGAYTLTTESLQTGASTTVLASAEGPEATTIELDTATIEAGGDDELTVKGFMFNGTDSSNDPDGAIAHTEGSDSADVEGSLTVEDNIFDTSVAYRNVESDETATVTVEDNFFTGSSDAGVEFGSEDGGDLSLTVKGNTFAGIGDKGVALRVDSDRDGDTNLEIENNNFVFNSKAGIEVTNDGADYTHADFDTESNYFSHNGDKVEENDAGASYTLNEATSPQDESGVSLQPGEVVEVVQPVYFAAALEPQNYEIQTKVRP